METGLISSASATPVYELRTSKRTDKIFFFFYLLLTIVMTSRSLTNLLMKKLIQRESVFNVTSQINTRQ